MEEDKLCNQLESVASKLTLGPRESYGFLWFSHLYNTITATSANEQWWLRHNKPANKIRHEGNTVMKLAFIIIIKFIMEQVCEKSFCLAPYFRGRQRLGHRGWTEVSWPQVQGPFSFISSLLYHIKPCIIWCTDAPKEVGPMIFLFTFHKSEYSIVNILYLLVAY